MRPSGVERFGRTQGDVPIQLVGEVGPIDEIKHGGDAKGLFRCGSPTPRWVSAISSLLIAMSGSRLRAKFRSWRCSDAGPNGDVRR